MGVRRTLGVVYGPSSRWTRALRGAEGHTVRVAPRSGPALVGQPETPYQLFACQPVQFLSVVRCPNTARNPEA